MDKALSSLCPVILSVCFLSDLLTYSVIDEEIILNWRTNHVLAQPFPRTQAFRSVVIGDYIDSVISYIKWVLVFFEYSLFGIFFVPLHSATISCQLSIHGSLWQLLYWLSNGISGQQYSCITSLPLHFLLILKDSVISTTRLSVSPPGHADFPTIWATIICDFLISNFNDNMLLNDCC